MSEPEQSAAEWPNAPCVLDKVYVMDTQFDHRIIVMHEHSWGRFGTQMESMRQLLANQNDRIKELTADVAARDIKNADMLTRLENLRAVRRDEKRADIEGGLLLPGSVNFSSQPRKR
jgi:hypothetical protein